MPEVFAEYSARACKVPTPTNPKEATPKEEATPTAETVVAVPEQAPEQTAAATTRRRCRMAPSRLLLLLFALLLSAGAGGVYYLLALSGCDRDVEDADCQCGFCSQNDTSYATLGTHEAEDAESCRQTCLANHDETAHFQWNYHIDENARWCGCFANKPDRWIADVRCQMCTLK